jgi:site-specific DNA-methyltransferase (adenine-specific)
MGNKIYYADNLEVLKSIPSASIDLIYIDPPFNTGKTQSLHDKSYSDDFANFEDFIYPRLKEAYRILTPRGSLYFHIDYREVHYCKRLLDIIFGRKNFLNEIIWVYDYGARSKTRWSAKHDNILWYVKDANNYIFNYEEMERIPYMSPELVGKEKAEKGKTVTDTWWHTIVATNGKERLGYPTQKPLGIIRRIVKVSSLPDSTVMDFFAGSGTLGAAALESNRKFILVDNSLDAIKTMQHRFHGIADIEWL